MNNLKKNFESYLHIIRSTFNKQNHFQEARSRFLESLPFLFAALMTALAATLYAKAFHYFEVSSIHLIQSLGYFSLVLTPLLFILSWALVEFFSPYANGSGIPQLMAAAEISNHDSKNPLMDKLLALRIIVIKVVSSLIGVLGGGAIGREGPTLQISGSIFHLVGKFLNKEKHSPSHHIMILAGGAAGLAAAFNTPLGGIVYAMEELSKAHLSAFRTGVLQAVIVSGFFAQFILGPYLYLGYPKVDTFQISQLGYLIMVATTAGLIVALFSQILKKIVLVRGQVKTRFSKMMIAAFCGLTVAALGIFINPSTFGSGNEVLNELLFSNKTADIYQVMTRFAGSALTYGAGGAGGIFAPTLSLGATVASFVQSFFENHLGAMGVLCGMAAGLAALTHSPLTSFVLILEMTDRHSAIFPLMLAALIGQGISKLVSKTSFYEFVCQRILATPKTIQNSEN